MAWRAGDEAEAPPPSNVKSAEAGVEVEEAAIRSAQMGQAVEHQEDSEEVAAAEGPRHHLEAEEVVGDRA